MQARCYKSVCSQGANHVSTGALFCVNIHKTILQFTALHFIVIEICSCRPLGTYLLENSLAIFNVPRLLQDSVATVGGQVLEYAFQVNN